MRRWPALLLLGLMAQAPSNKAAIDTGLDALKIAPTEEAAGQIEGKLRAMWVEAATPAVRLLLSRGRRELSGGDGNEALDSFDAALDLDGDLVEAWRGRARARLAIGDSNGAIRDIQEALRREPRNFAAWQDLSHIAEARNDWRGALAAWTKVLELDPHSPGGQDRLHDLRRRALGEDA